MSSGGKDTLSLEERSRNVQDLLQVLMDINDINGGNSDTAEKMKVHAKNFEAALYAKSSSKKEYMDSMREKVHAMRNTRDTRKKAAASAVSMGAVNRAMFTQQQQQQQRFQQAGMTVNGGFVPNTLNMNPHIFLNQQAQVRQQAQQQLRNQQQAQQQQQPHVQHQRPQLAAQHQQLINQMKVAIIPRELLQRIPNIPPGVNTWQQITELAQQKRLTAQDMQVAKEIYKLHQQLLYKSRLQQANVNNRISLQQQGQLHQQRMSGLNGIQAQRAAPQQMSHQSQGAAQQQQQQPQRQQGRPIRSEGELPNMLGQINQIFAPDEQRALLHEAMEACKNFQKTQFGSNMTDSNRQDFIRKYINQKAIKKIQSLRLAQMANSGATPPQHTAGSAGGATTSGLHRGSALSGASAGGSSGGGQHNSSGSGMHGPMHSQGSLNGLYGQSNLRNNSASVNAAQAGASLQQNNRIGQSQARPSVLQAFTPTPQDVQVVRRISADAARTPLRLSDLTNSISSQERDEIKRMLQINQQLFAQVSNYAPQVYILTKNENFLKDVLQLRIFVKEIFEKCAKGIYVVKLDTMEKLVSKYKKYWESMKIQLVRRQQLVQQQQQLQQQKQKLAAQQQVAANSQTGLNISQQQQRVQGSLQQIQQQMQQRQRQHHQQQQQQQQVNRVPSNNNNIGHTAQQTGRGMINPNGTPAMNTSVNVNYQQSLSDSSIGIQPDPSVGMEAPKNGLGLDFMGSPNMSKGTPSAGTMTGMSPKRDFIKASATGNFTKARSNSIKASPNTSQSNMNTPVMVPPPSGSGSGTPGVSNVGDGISPLNGKSMLLGNHKTPSPLSVPSIPQGRTSASNVDSNPFKQEEEALRRMIIRKAEIISRFKHRQEIFGKSYLDVFLSTVADCIGVKDSDVETVVSIPQVVADQVNGTAKKKVSKMAQKARDQDVVSVSIKDNNKLIMESKTDPNPQAYKIPPSALASVFRDVYGTSDIMTMNFNDPFGVSRSVSDSASRSSGQANSKKRKQDELEISPANSVNSPSSSLMSDSKKIKVDTPEDMFVTRGNGDTDAKQALDAAIPVSNVWDWNYWAKLDQP